MNQRGTPPDGGVHDLYTIAGRSDAPGCNVGQPDFNTQLGNNNVVFRIPTPIFGLGLVEATLDSVLQSNLSAKASAKARLGISGKLNTSGNDGTVTRFGWRAQNKSHNWHNDESVMLVILSAPVLSSDQKVVGVIQVCRKGKCAAVAGLDFTHDDLKKLNAVALTIGSVMAPSRE